MRIPRLFVFAALLVSALAAAQPSTESGWPEITRENKPWTRWWWPGSAVDKASLTWQLEKLAAAGIGGVEITPIYGAKGYESRYLDFLSPPWMEMLTHTGREAKRLGLGVDMATGTGWPFGGPWIDEPNAMQRAVLREGKIVGEPTKMMVKRAAPGDEGLVVDPFSPNALRRYLGRFDQPFAHFPRELVRAQFHDSFEYFNASWTARLPVLFRELHGYDIQQFATELLTRNSAEVKSIDRDTLARVKSDYRDTLATLHLDYLRTWVEWSHQHGFLVRNQSHGAPANLLDLYGAVDIAETEIFGSTPFPIPGLRRNLDEVRHDQDLPESLVIRMASSAAHVAGHKFASSESATWLRDHWKESLAYVKPELDRILADGINHIFYHGTVFSPQDAPWPGWLFYASTQFQPNNPWWDDFGALNRYIARIQSILQAGKPDNDILLYWPVSDVWDNADGLAKMLAVHDVKWLTEQPFGKIARSLMEHGYTFDYISDAQLQQTRAGNSSANQIASRPIETATGGSYKMVLVPAARRMPLATLQKLVELGRAGAVIAFISLPEDVPGYGRLPQRRAEMEKLKSEARTLAANRQSPLTIGAEGASDVIAAAKVGLHVTSEPAAERGIAFTRRATATGHDYFFTNLTGKPVDDWIGIAAKFETADILDPLTGRIGRASTRSLNRNQEIFLQLAPGESLLVRTSAQASPASKPWPYRQPAGASVAINGKWHLVFTKGGPELPPALTTTALKSWTELGGEEAKRFAGTARYRIKFDAPAAPADDWLLDLGDVRESARVRLNGKDVGTVWSLPMRIRVGEHLKSGRNLLELDVTNLAANRIRDMDGANDPKPDAPAADKAAHPPRKTEWKIMREINFVNINYKPFDASAWPLTPSGLLGPVTLVPLKALGP